jgi:putative hemolysin
MLIAQGTEHGTFEEAEQEMVEGVFRLGDRRAVELMKPRGNVAWLDVEDPWEVNREVIANSDYSRFPVVEGGLDRVIGVVHVKELFLSQQSGEPPDLRKLARTALFVPELMPALDILERFQMSGEQMALVVDEHGGVEGVATLTDLMEAVVGDIRGPGQATQDRIVRRDDGSWLVDGSLPISDLVEELDLREELVDEGGFNTVGGFILAHLRRIPSAGDAFESGGWRFEVLDMDRNRIDKVLATRMEDAES